MTVWPLQHANAHFRELLDPAWLQSANDAVLYADVTIAAIARVHNLTVVTRNLADFQEFGVALLNPFEHR